MRMIYDRELKTGTGTWEPALIACECGSHLFLSDDETNECPDCGLLYNKHGQELMPREELPHERPGLPADVSLAVMEF